MHKSNFRIRKKKRKKKNKFTPITNLQKREENNNLDMLTILNISCITNVISLEPEGH